MTSPAVPSDLTPGLRSAPVSHRRARPVRRSELWVRIAYVILLAVLGFFELIVVNASNGAAGSQTGYLVMTPILGGLIATGYSHPPRGVSDTESDWIIAVLTGVSGIAAMHLFGSRLPTLAGLWHLHNVEMVIWIATAGMVVFTVRHILRMWSVWYFAAICAPGLPFFLVTAWWGGSDTAVALQAAAVGAVAVFFAARFVIWRWRLIASALSFALSAAVVLYLPDVSTFVKILIVTGAVPVFFVLGLHRYTNVTKSHRFAHVTAGFPHRKWTSYVALLLIAVGLLALHLTVERRQVPPQARADWITQLHLRKTADFPFISRFVGPGTTLTRYQPATDARIVVDVISAPNLARLQDFSNAVWYPSGAPPNYAPTALDGRFPITTLTAHSDADSAVTGTDTQWYLLTWQWQTGDSYQQVTVVANQSAASSPPVQPRPITWGNALFGPMLWLARQQPDSSGAVDPRVERAAQSVAHVILVAGAPT